ncbi:MAG: DNA polymerase II [Desulfurococcales archaeon]|jgi:DNA polymerase I|nr:DNA polymerase II [Desulfurococcales archaeon]
MEEILDIFVLDLSYEVVRSEPHVIIWGIDSSGNRVLLRDRSFRPYFYVVLEDTAPADHVADMIRKLSMQSSPITDVRKVDKRFYGRPVNVLRVQTVIPESVREYRERVKGVAYVSEVLEADIRFALRYMIDRNTSPSTWHRFRVRRIPRSNDYRVSEEYEIVERLGSGDITRPPNLRSVAFDIEVYNPRGSPRPEIDPVIIIGVMDDEGKVEQFLAEDPGPKDLRPIREFIEYIVDRDPDILFGYNSTYFDIPYLMERCKRHGMKLDIGRRKGAEPRPSVYGHYSIPGRLHVDLYDFAEEIHEVKIKSLDVVAEYLGVMSRSERTYVSWYEIARYWDDRSRRPILLKYSRDDVLSTYGIGMKILPFAIQLSSLTGLPLDQVGAASVGHRLEWYLMREAYKYGELVPNREDRPYEPYKGAVVLEPKPGIHSNIAVMDFSSMYPNIMIKYNIGPDTYVSDQGKCGDEGCWEAPETGYLFRKSPPGFYKMVLETLLKLRRSVREEMKKYDVDSIEYRILDERQRALKILANAAYGYMGWVGARWYFRQGAEAVTAWGRATIKRAIDIARSMGLNVIYGDTDSLFIGYIKGTAEEFAERISRELEMEIKIEKIYRKVFFTEAKKRYVGLTEDGRIDIVGFEAVRGDWSELAKEIQERVAEVILRTEDISKAIEYVRSVIKDLEAGRIPLEKLVIWKTITRPLEEYEATAPHVRAAKILLSRGGRVAIGDKIGYVIVKGAGRVSDRAIPYFFADPKDIDSTYYVDHQVIPAALRILEYFGVSDKTLRSGAKSRSLFDYSR